MAPEVGKRLIDAGNDCRDMAEQRVRSSIDWHEQSMTVGKRAMCVAQADERSKVS